MQGYKLIENKDNFQKPLGTFCFAVVTKSENSDSEMIHKLCDHEHNTMDEAKECEEAIGALEAGGFDPTGRFKIEEEQKELSRLINKYPDSVLYRVDYDNSKTWPPHAFDVLMFAPGTGFCVGEFHVDEFTGPMFCDWNDRESDEDDANYNEVPNVTHYLLLELPK